MMPATKEKVRWREAWVVELHWKNFGFVTHAGGYDSEAAAKAAAARAFKGKSQIRRVRVALYVEPVVIHEATFCPGKRTRWTPHPGNL